MLLGEVKSAIVVQVQAKITIILNNLKRNTVESKQRLTINFNSIKYTVFSLSFFWMVYFGIIVIILRYTFIKL